MGAVLEPHLAQRVEPGVPRPRSEGAFIVYWMRVAARATENPALDVALALGAAMKKPVFVYHALSERYRYASDRIHTFVLEGARDVQLALRERGVGAVFHLERGGHREPVLMHLAKQAAVVVTDFMPVEPLLRWDAAVASVAPLWRVDASCVAPLWQFTRPVERAFEFRALAQPSWQQQLSIPWRDVEPTGPAFLPDLPFEPLDLQGADLAALVAACDIDHGVGPVHHTKGGSVAGDARWRRFLDTRLDGYARARNDPAVDGTSRLSAYLHFGHVSPFTLARAANARRTEGAQTWLDELLTWRELAWHFCWHNPGHERVEVLPTWARTTLQQHERDPRRMLPSWETLARAQTGDPLWDACQRQLLTHGELHNSTRMTWGKALLSWTRSARDALALLIDLNHRYALDGRDPGSYGGILWCLGGFDRPFTPEVPVLGQVRPRPLDAHAGRINLAEYTRRTRLASRGQPLTVAIVGAGVAGAAAARTLMDAGHAVTLFDKGRGAGGRLSTRKEATYRFDHGAPSFTVTDERFARWARAWWQERVIAEWKPRVATLGAGPTVAQPAVRLVGVPGMSAVVSRLLLDLDVRFNTQVGQVVRDDGRWRLATSEGTKLGEFDALVLATPAPQAAALIDAAAFDVASRLREVSFSPCQALMVAFDESLGLEWDAAVSRVGPLGWLACDSSKPERVTDHGERWVFHATPEWSTRHLEDASDFVAAQLLDAVFATTGARRLEPRFLKAHRWRYSTVSRSLGEDCLFDQRRQLVACGDWCRGGGVEAAFLSGVAAAARLNALEGPPGDQPESPYVRHPAQLLLLK
jgi:photolyase PhrII